MWRTVHSCWWEQGTTTLVMLLCTLSSVPRLEVIVVRGIYWPLARWRRGWDAFQILSTDTAQHPAKSSIWDAPFSWTGCAARGGLFGR